MSNIPRSILVTGDYGIDHDIYLHSDQDNPPPDNPPTVIRATFGGAAVIENLLKEAMPGQKTGGPLVQIASSATPTAPDVAALWHPYPACSLAKGEAAKEMVWRVKRSTCLGKLKSDQSQRVPAKKMPSLDGLKAIGADILVIADERGEFRTSPPPSFERLLNAQRKVPFKLIVLKTCAPVGHGPLWWTLTAADKNGQRQFADRLAVILHIKDLRRANIRISQGIFWERTAQDLARELKESAALAGLRQARHVIVTFHREGALWMEREDGGGLRFRLLFDPAHMEAEWTDKTVPAGNAYGFHAAFAAALAARYALSTKGTERDWIEEGIERGVLAMRLMRAIGHGPAKAEADPGMPWKDLGHFLAVENLANGSAGGIRWADLGALARADVHIQGYWRILEAGGLKGGARANPIPLYGKARRVALIGLNELDSVPYARFGDYLTADRDEIEALRNLKRLINGYAKDEHETKPLSLAVFGPPGAGKSFGIKEVAGAVVEPEKRAFLEFNLSQFDDSRELIGAFHQVRDKVLEGKLPVVFWDEFDSQNYKWLQYLLAPMQDGKFQDGQIIHPIGRCIFVFAGATSFTYENFGPPKAPRSAKVEDGREHRQSEAEFKLKKGPDFVSRLHGYLNVLGPNPRQLFSGTDWNDDPTDVCFPVRRAIFLRAKLGLMDVKKKTERKRLDMDPGLLAALLETGHYTHGSRSFEKLILPIKKDGEHGYHRSSLPGDAILEMNVKELNQFKQIMAEDREFQKHADLMAAAIHARWMQIADAANQFRKAFEKLDPEAKEDNRAAALRVPAILGLVGLSLVENKDPRPALPDSEIKSILESQIEVLAEEEHNGWMDVRLKNGWLPAERTEDPAERRKQRNERLHDCLIPYTKLPEAEKDKDRGSVRWYTKLAKLAKFKIVALQR